MKKIDIMEHVSILDRIRIHIMQVKPGNFELQIESLDNTKNVVFDKKSLKELNHQILERVRDRSATDPKTASYIQEFCAKMICRALRIIYMNIKI